MNKKSLKFSPVGTIFKFTCRTESVKKRLITSLLFVRVPPIFPKRVLINFFQSQDDNREKGFFCLKVIKKRS